MAYASSTLRLPAETPLPRIATLAPATLIAWLVAPVRRRWIYHRTLSELQGYSERNLVDLGAGNGVREFARRAAGL